MADGRPRQPASPVWQISNPKCFSRRLGREAIGVADAFYFVGDTCRRLRPPTEGRFRDPQFRPAVLPSGDSAHTYLGRHREGSTSPSTTTLRAA